MLSIVQSACVSDMCIRQCSMRDSTCVFVQLLCSLFSFSSLVAVAPLNIEWCIGKGHYWWSRERSQLTLITLSSIHHLSLTPISIHPSLPLCPRFFLSSPCLSFVSGISAFHFSLFYSISIHLSSCGHQLQWPSFSISAQLSASLSIIHRQSGHCSPVQVPVTCKSSSWHSAHISHSILCVPWLVVCVNTFEQCVWEKFACGRFCLRRLQGAILHCLFPPRMH